MVNGAVVAGGWLVAGGDDECRPESWPVTTITTTTRASTTSPATMRPGQLGRRRGDGRPAGTGVGWRSPGIGPPGPLRAPGADNTEVEPGSAADDSTPVAPLPSAAESCHRCPAHGSFRPVAAVANEGADGGT